MAYRVGSDRAGHGTRKCLDKVIEVLKDGGKNEVVDLGITPNLEHKLGEGSGEDIGVFVVNGICLGTMVSCYLGQVKSGKVKEIYFCIPQETYGGHLIKSADDIKSTKVPITNDGTHWNKMAYDWSGKYSTQEICDKLKGINYGYGKTCEEAAKQVLAGGGAQPGGGSEGETSTGNAGGGAAIKDKTFEDCIRRICAATDSVFIVENNAAVLFPYTDWMAFTLQKQIHTIQAKEIDPDVFEKQYSPDGTYNKVTATWGGEELPDRDFNKTNKTDTISSTKGKVTTKEKNNKDGSVMLSKQYDELVDTFGELEKRVELKVNDRNTAEYIVNALLIQYVREFNNAYKVRTLNQRKYIGGTFYAVENPFDKKVVPLYLNGYSIRTQKNTPLYVDLDFRYGPLGVEDIGDYQNYSGSGGGSSTSNEESSTESSGQSLGSNAIEVGNALAKKYTYKQHAGSESYGAMKKKGYGSCFAWSGALYTELKAIGYTVRVIQYATKYSPRHRSVQYKDKSGNWVDYPYRDTKIDNMAWATSGSSHGKVVLDENGKGIAKGILS